MLQVTVTSTFDLLTKKINWIICQPWPTTTPILVSLSLIDFKLLGWQEFCAQGHCDLDLLPPKSIRIIHWSWQSIIPRKVYLGEISLKLMSGQDFANAGQTDGHRSPYHNTTGSTFWCIKKSLIGKAVVCLSHQNTSATVQHCGHLRIPKRLTLNLITYVFHMQAVKINEKKNKYVSFFY